MLVIVPKRGPESVWAGNVSSALKALTKAVAAIPLSASITTVLLTVLGALPMNNAEAIHRSVSPVPVRHVIRNKPTPALSPHPYAPSSMVC
jgi:hypothetical protein